MVDIPRARKAFKEFSGHDPSRQYSARLDDRDVAGWKIGRTVGVAYEAKRDGETARYFHEFKKSVAPDLVVREDGKQLYFVGGRYKVTDHGIEDMPALFVVNPSPRPSKRKAASKRKKAPMATRRRRKTARRRAPAVAVYARNPAPRRRRRRRATFGGFRRNPIRATRRRSVRRYRRNPIRARRAVAGFNKLSQMVLPAVGIGAGAVGAEIVMGYLPLPPMLKTGVARHVTKGAVGIAGGIVIGKLLKQPRLGKFFAAGAVAIAAHDALKEVIVANMPSVKFGEYLPRGSVAGSLGYYSPASTVAMGEYIPAAAVRTAMGESPDFEA